MHSTVVCYSGQPWMRQCPEIFMLVEVSFPVEIVAIKSTWYFVNMLTVIELQTNNFTEFRMLNFVFRSDCKI